MSEVQFIIANSLNSLLFKFYKFWKLPFKKPNAFLIGQISQKRLIESFLQVFFMIFKELLAMMSIVRFFYLLKFVLSSELTTDIFDYTQFCLAELGYFCMVKVGLRVKINDFLVPFIFLLYFLKPSSPLFNSFLHLRRNTDLRL